MQEAQLQEIRSIMRVYPLFYIVLVPVQGPLKLIDSELDD
jgi:hypothetical protein